MKSYTVSGVMLMFAGIGCFASAGVLLKESLAASRIAETTMKAADARCIGSLKRIGIVVEGDDGAKVSVDQVKDPRLAFSDAAAALAGCPERSLTEFCIGSACGDDGRQVRSEEHTSELQSLMRISYAVFCLKKKKQKTKTED